MRPWPVYFLRPKVFPFLDSCENDPQLNRETFLVNSSKF
jgi:hypothetical protein